MTSDLPLSVRQIFYQVLGPRYPGDLAVVPKGGGYKKVQGLVRDLRREGVVPYAAIEDYSRRMVVTNTYSGLRGFLQHHQSLYRVDPFRDASVQVQVWCESEGVGSTIQATCREYGLHLFPAKGQSSDSFIYTAAKAAQDGRPVIMIYIGDHDRYGLTYIPESIWKRLSEHLRQREIPLLPIIRVAVNEDQIDRYDLPFAPPELTKAGEVDRVVQAEAIDPSELRNMLRQQLDTYLPSGGMVRARAEEDIMKAELRRLGHMADNPIALRRLLDRIEETEEDDD